MSRLAAWSGFPTRVKRASAGKLAETPIAPPSAPAAPELLRGTFDSLTSHIAVLDEHGEIVMTNRAWSSFASANGGVASEGTGTNYLSACDAARDDEASGQAAAGLREIIAGDRREFTLEYPCHGPDVERWFMLRATRYEGAGPVRVVVAHDDITSRRAAERSLLAAGKHMRAVADSMGEGLFTLDQGGRFIDVNETAEKLLGWSTAELQGRVMHDVAHSFRPDGTHLPIEECPIREAQRKRRRAHIQDEVFIRRDGRALPVDYTVAPLLTDEGGAGCVVVFENITERKEREATVEADAEMLSSIARIRDALAHDRFVLHAQPIIDIASGEVVQRELLLRMREPDGELVPPGVFLPVAEEWGLIGDIDRWVIEHGIEIAAGGALELNLSAHSIGDPTVLELIERVLARTRVDPRRLVFEITETALISNVAAAGAFAERLHALGCKLALDDFGTGYGGFIYLKRFPLDLLKIDIEFVRDLPNAASEHVISAVVSLARAFGLQTVAEGVGDGQTLAQLGELGVDFAQGSHIGGPEPVASVKRRPLLGLPSAELGLSIKVEDGSRV